MRTDVPLVPVLAGAIAFLGACGQNGAASPTLTVTQTVIETRQPSDIPAGSGGVSSSPATQAPESQSAIAPEGSPTPEFKPSQERLAACEASKSVFGALNSGPYIFHRNGHVDPQPPQIAIDLMRDAEAIARENEAAAPELGAMALYWNSKWLLFASAASGNYKVAQRAMATLPTAVRPGESFDDYNARIAPILALNDLCAEVGVAVEFD